MLNYFKSSCVLLVRVCYFDSELRKVQATGTKNMQSIPYFHFTRTPLKEVYRLEYEHLIKKYGASMALWQEEWFEFLNQKYNI